jgi:hypothetical protein
MIDENEINIFIGNMQLARKAITDIHGTKKPKENIRSAMPCGVCRTGTLHYSISSYNGHIHAKCDTPKCIQWME